MGIWFFIELEQMVLMVRMKKSIVDWWRDRRTNNPLVENTKHVRK
jgi:hypothetical protein